MADDKKNCKIIHYGSNKCKLIACYVMTAEVLALVLGKYLKYIVKYLVEDIIGTNIRLETIIYRNTVFYGVEKDVQTEERRLQINVLP